MRRSVCRCLAGLCALAPLSAAAQSPAPTKPGPWVLDIRVSTGGVPQDATFFPPVPPAAIIPERGLGIDAGAHIYLISLGPARLGVGASLVHIRARASAQMPSGTSTSASAVARQPDVETRFRSLTPQLSLNFGSGDGWSYISAGAGRALIDTATSAFLAASSGTGSGREGAAPMIPSRSVDTTLRSINAGGGARWFAQRHLAFSFDVRFHSLSGGAGEVATPGTTLVAVSAGISLK